MKSIVSCIALAAIAGCGANSLRTGTTQSSASERSQAPGRMPDEQSAHAPQSSGAGPSLDAEARAPASLDSSAARERGESYRPEPLEQSRPGLGTEWGETQTSRVSNVSFERANFHNPTSLTTLHYNDAEGVRAMTRGNDLSYMTRGTVPRGGLSVRLLDSSGSPLPSYDFGSGTVVMGNHGDRYVIQIRNDTPNRFEAVASVDGLDVMDGRAGSFQKRGYLVGPWATLEIDGFRQNLDEVAAFRFGSVDRSYAAKTGNARNVGVIGVAFFSERGARVPFLDREVERRKNADPFPGRFAAPPP